MSSELEKQAEQIDSGKVTTPTSEVQKSASLLGTSMRDVQARKAAIYKMNPNSMESRGMVSSFGMADLTQSEFEDFDYKGLDKGITSGDSQNEVRAQNQGGWGELGTALTKVGTEVTLGTASGVSLIPQTVAQLMGAQQDYSNSISEALDSYKADLNEKYGKTYVAAENEGFAPFSSEAWANNAGNIATTLSLMIPTWGFTKALGATAKALKVEQGLAKFAAASKEASLLGEAAKWSISRPGKEVLTGLAAASFSRNVESTMEASQTFKETKEALSVRDIHTGEFIGYKINPKTGVSFSEDEVNKIAGDAASSNYKKNWVMLAQDFLQYKHMFKGMDYARRAAQETVKKGLGARAFGATMDAAGEGFEEGYQYISSKESVHSQLVDAGLKKESNWTDRYLQYMQDDEFKTSVMLGAVGAGVMKAGGKILNAISPYIGKGVASSTDPINPDPSTPIQPQGPDLSNVEGEAVNVQEAAEAALTGDSVKFEEVRFRSFRDNIISKASEGKLANLEIELHTMLNDTDENIEAQGEDPKEYRANVQRYLDLTAKGAEYFNQAVNDPTIDNRVVGAITAAKMDLLYEQQAQKTITDARTKAEKEDLETFTAKEVKTAQQVLELQRLINSVAMEENPEKVNPKVVALANSIVEASDVYNSLEDLTAVLDTPSIETYSKLNTQQREATQLKANAQHTAAKLRTKEGQQEYLKEVEKHIRAKESAKEIVAEGLADKSAASNIAGSIIAAEARISAENPTLSIEEVHAKAKEVVSSVIAPKTETFKVGDIAVNSRGKQSKVLEVDAEGNITKAERDGHVVEIHPNERKYLNKLIVEVQPEVQVASATSTVQPIKEEQIEVQDAITNLFGESLSFEEAAGEDTSKSESKDAIVVTETKTEEESKVIQPSKIDNPNTHITVNLEFDWSSWVKTGDGKYKFVLKKDNPVPVKLRQDQAIYDMTEGVGIDYEAAAKPMKPGIQERVTLKFHKLNNGKYGIGVWNKEGKLLSQVAAKGNNNFDSLLQQVRNTPEGISATIINKVVTLERNLANIELEEGTYRRSLAEFFSVNEDLTTNGEIFIGSSKNSANIDFYGNKGNKAQGKFSAKNIQEHKDANSLAGSSYMLIKKLNGENIHVQLFETQVGNATVNGKNLADTIRAEMAERLGELQQRVNSDIAALTPEEVVQYTSSNEIIGPLNTEFKEVAHKYIREVDQSKESGTANKYHIQLQVGFKKGTTTLEIYMKYRDANGKAVTTTDPNVIAGRINISFFDMNLNKLSDPRYVQLIIDNGLVTTDVYVERPWVNPTLRIQVGEDTVVEASNSARESVVDVPPNVVVEPVIVTPKTVSEQHPAVESNVLSNSLFNASDKTLRKGSVVNYNGKRYLFWNENSSGKAQLITTEGEKFSGTPDMGKLEVLGGYSTTIYNEIEYIVTDNGNVYSGATGKKVYTGKDNSSVTQREAIEHKAVMETRAKQKSAQETKKEINLSDALSMMGSKKRDKSTHVNKTQLSSSEKASSDVVGDVDKVNINPLGTILTEEQKRNAVDNTKIEGC